MGRKKVAQKNISISISIPKYQQLFLKKHPDFNLTRFVQIILDDYISSVDELEEKMKGVFGNGKKTVE